MWYAIKEDELYHHGIKGQKWGVRRFQNPDGTLTGVGQKRYVKQQNKADRFSRSMDKYIARSEKSDTKILSKREQNRAKLEGKFDKKIAKSEADAHSYDSIRDGLKDNKGRTIFTKEDVDSMVGALNKRTEELKAKKNSKLQDFDNGTKAVTAGSKKYNEIMKNYRDVKVNQILTGTKSPEYKKAVKAYVNQVVSDSMTYGGSSMTKLKYAGEYATSQGYGA